MSNIIDFMLGIASRLSVRRAAYHPGTSGCAESIDPTPVIESLAMSRQWHTGGDLADAYQSGCPRHLAQRHGGRSP